MKLIGVAIVAGIVVIGVAIGVLVLMSGSGPDGGNGNSDSIPTDVDLAYLELEVPNWGMLMSDDEILEMESLRGRFVVVDLMQTGECLPCKQQTVHLKDLYSDYSDRLYIMSLSLVLSDTVARLAEFKSDNSIPWYVGLDTEGAFGSYFNARSVPTLVIIDDEGFFRYLHVGVWSRAAIESTLSLLDT